MSRAMRANYSARAARFFTLAPERRTLIDVSAADHYTDAAITRKGAPKPVMSQSLSCCSTPLDSSS